MNLEQTLERLAVVARVVQRVEIHGSVAYEVEIDGLWWNALVAGSEGGDYHFLLEAICKKVEAEGWSWSMPNTGAKYSFVIWGTGIDIAPHGMSDIHPAHAAAQALLAALEAKACICNDTQQVKTIPNCDEGDFTEVMADCPFCTVKQPNAETQAAIDELDAGGGDAFASTEELFEDLENGANQ